MFTINAMMVAVIGLSMLNQRFDEAAGRQMHRKTTINTTVSAMAKSPKIDSFDCDWENKDIAVADVITTVMA